MRKALGRGPLVSLFITALMLRAPAAHATPPTLAASGISHDVPVASLSGWTQCFLDTYDTFGPPLTTILDGCLGDNLLMACRVAGSATLALAAHAPRADVIFETGTSNTPHDANGVGWYFNDSWSWGFARLGDPLDRDSCDVQGTNAEDRLCWHTGGGEINSGYRCGDNNLNGDSGWERLIFTSDDPCGNGVIDSGEECDDGNTSDGDCCSMSCTSDSAGNYCDDNDACTQTDSCDGDGHCVGANAVTCPPIACRDAGTCNPLIGTCSYPVLPEGAPCDDDNPCTTDTTCDELGDCTGTPITCSALDDCHLPGLCDTGTGLCDDPPAASGEPCDDEDACTETDTCDGNGACIGASPVVCSALDQCHDVGTCDSLTGNCSNPAKADGAPCDDDDPCTQTDTCDTGSCTGAFPVVCNPLDQCHDAGTCNPLTGDCSNPAKADGAPCDDDDLCTQTDTCDTGSCTGAFPVVCNPQSQCHDAGTCNPSTGSCSNPTKPNGTTCTDNDACTIGDTCNAGVCLTSPPIVCVAQDQCHDAGTCDANTGECSEPAKANGATCDDENELTYDDACTAGACGGTPITCGDNIVQEVTGEACDAGAANGTDQCCSATCQVVDADQDGTCDRDDACPNDAANDADDDGVCDDVDNCVGTANADQADMDGDTIGDACDATDAPLGLSLVRLRPGPFHRHTRATVVGTVSTADHALDLANGLTIRIQDGGSFDQSRTLDSTDCTELSAAGRMICRADDGYVRIRFARDRTNANLYRFRVYIRRLPLTATYEGPATVTLTDVGDRAGVADRCATAPSALTCRPSASRTKK